MAIHEQTPEWSWVLNTPQEPTGVMGSEYPILNATQNHFKKSTNPDAQIQVVCDLLAFVRELRGSKVKVFAVKVGCAL